MALSPTQQSATSTRKPSAQSITPELRRWIIEQAQAGFSAPVVLQSMRDAGWDEDVAADAMETTLQEHLNELAVLTVIICHRLQHSRIGRAWVALREDDVAANAMGLNIRNIKLLAFAMGATFGGVAGGLFASFQGFVSPESFGLMESIMVLAMVVLGGMGNISGVILGAVLLTVTPELLRDIIGPLQMKAFGRMIVDPENARMLMFGLALIVVMLVRPEGLWPSKRRKAEFHDALDDGIPAADSQAADGLKG